MPHGKNCLNFPLSATGREVAARDQEILDGVQQQKQVLALIFCRSLQVAAGLFRHYTEWPTQGAFALRQVRRARTESSPSDNWQDRVNHGHHYARPATASAAQTRPTPAS